MTRQVEETQRVEGLFKARERAWREEDRERERRGREGVEEVEQEVERQVEETKRVEAALRLREKEVRDLKVRRHPYSTPAVRWLTSVKPFIAPPRPFRSNSTRPNLLQLLSGARPTASMMKTLTPECHPLLRRSLLLL